MKYRGVTFFATTGLKFDELFGINTAEELITAELYGRRAVPSGDPENRYLFSNDRSKTARYNSRYFQSMRDKSETEHLKAARTAYVPKTMEELHTQYLNSQIPSALEDLAWVEAQLEAVAIDTVRWWSDFTKTQTLEDRQQCGCRKDRSELARGEADEHDCKQRESTDSK